MAILLLKKGRGNIGSAGTGIHIIYKRRIGYGRWGKRKWGNNKDEGKDKGKRIRERRKGERERAGQCNGKDRNDSNTAARVAEGRQVRPATRQAPTLTSILTWPWDCVPDICVFAGDRGGQPCDICDINGLGVFSVNPGLASANPGVQYQDSLLILQIWKTTDGPEWGYETSIATAAAAVCCCLLQIGRWVSAADVYRSLTPSL